MPVITTVSNSPVDRVRAAGKFLRLGKRKFAVCGFSCGQFTLNMAGESRQARLLQEHKRCVFKRGLAGSFVFSFADDWFTGEHQIENCAFGVTRVDGRSKPAAEVLGAAWGASPYLPEAAYPPISVIVCSYNGARTLRGYDKSLAAECPLSPAANRREVLIAERTCRGWLRGRGQGEGAAVTQNPSVRFTKTAQEASLHGNAFNASARHPPRSPSVRPHGLAVVHNFTSANGWGEGTAFQRISLSKNAQRGIPSVAEVLSAHPNAPLLHRPRPLPTVR